MDSVLLLCIFQIFTQTSAISTNPIATTNGSFTTQDQPQFAYDNSGGTCASTDGSNNMAASTTFTFNGSPIYIFQVSVIGPSTNMPADMFVEPSPITLWWGNAPCAQVTPFSPTNTIGIYSCRGYGSSLTINIGAGRQASICNIMLSSYNPQLEAPVKNQDQRSKASPDDLQWNTTSTTSTTITDNPQSSASTTTNGYSPSLISFTPKNPIVQTSGNFHPQSPYLFAYDHWNRTCASTDGVVNNEIDTSITFGFDGLPFSLSQVYIIAPDVVPPDMYTGSPALTVVWGGLQCTLISPVSMTNSIGSYICSGVGSDLTITIGAGRQASICNILLYSNDPRWAISATKTSNPEEIPGTPYRESILMKIIKLLRHSLKLSSKYLSNAATKENGI